MYAAINDELDLVLDNLLSHGLVVGSTGTGKSSKFVYPLVEGLSSLMVDGEPLTIIIMDMKGEPWLFHAVRNLMAQINESRGPDEQIPFRWLNPTANHSSFAWNPFNQLFFYEQRRESRVQMLVKALGSDFGDFYGAKHFRAQGELLLREIFARFIIRSYAHLDAVIKHYRGKTTWFDKLLDKDSREFQSGISQMAQVTCMNVCLEDELFHVDSGSPLPMGFYGREVLDHHIEIADVVTRPQILYLNLTTITESTVGRSIPRAFVWQLLAILKWLEPQLAQFAYAMSQEEFETYRDSSWPTVEEAPGTLLSIAEEKISHKLPQKRIDTTAASNNGSPVAPPDDLIARLKGVVDSDKTNAYNVAPPKNLSTSAGRELVADIMQRASTLIEKLSAQ